MVRADIYTIEKLLITATQQKEEMDEILASLLAKSDTLIKIGGHSPEKEPMSVIDRKFFEILASFRAKSDTLIKLQNDNTKYKNVLEKWWQLFTLLLCECKIVEGRDFMIAEGYLYLRLRKIYKLYEKDKNIQRKTMMPGEKTIRAALLQNTLVCTGNVKKRFKDGSNAWSVKLFYDKIGINIRDKQHCKIQ